MADRIPPPPPGFTKAVPFPEPIEDGNIPPPPEGFTKAVDPTGQSYMAGLARAAVGQGMLMNWGDEAFARARQLGGEDYATALEDERAKVESFKKMNPKTALAAEIGGGFATPGLGVAGGLIKPAATLGKRILQSSAFGAGFGAAAGAGGAEKDRLSGAATGAGVGATIGAAIPPVASVVGAGAKAARDFVSPTLARWRADLDALRHRYGIHASAAGGATPGADAAAEQVIANQISRAGRSVGDLRRAGDEAREAGHFHGNSQALDATALVDLDPSLQRLAGSAARASPEAGNTAQAFITARQTGITPAGGLPAEAGIPTRAMMSRAGPNADPAGQGERLRDAFKRALLIRDEDFHGHAANAHRTDQAILQAARDEAQTLYSAAYEAGQNINIAEKTVATFRRWADRAAEEPAPVGKEILRSIKLFTNQQGHVVNNIERFDKAKQYLDGVIEKLFESSEGRNRYLGGVLTQFKNEILKDVDSITTNGLGAKYAQARAAFSSRMEARESLEMGRNAFKEDSDIGVDAFRSLTTPGHQKLFRLGMLSGYEKAAGGMKLGADKTQIFDRPNIQQLLSEVIPRTETATGRARSGATFADRPERFGRYVGNEKRMVETRNEVVGNSKTAQRLADDDAFEGMNKLASAVEQFKSSGSALNVGIKAAEAIFNKMFGMRADTSASLARMLFTANPEQRALLLSRIEQRIGRDRMAQFSRLMNEYQASLTAGTANAAASGAAGQTP